MDIIETILTRGVAEIIDRNHLEQALRGKNKLRIKLGIDPTAPDLHLGHTVVLRKLRQFQDAGHTAVLIIGDFTAQIGDPSGKSDTRKPLTEKEVKTNLKNYLKEAGRVLDAKRLEIRYNSEWHKKDGLAGLLRLAQHVSIQQAMEREDFQRRITEKNTISILEILYPMLQGYDSVAVKANVELGGTDQKFNLLMGRRMQRHFNMEEQDVLMVPLLLGTDGVKKMSKSYGNYVPLSATPLEMFSGVMKAPDALAHSYFELLTNVSEGQIKNLAPYEAKLLLAETIVGMYHSPKKGLEAKEEFIRVFSRKEVPEEMPSLRTKKRITLLDLVLQTGIPSKSEARRLIEQGAIEINGDTKKDPNEMLVLEGEEILKRGKKNFWKIEI